MHRHADIDFSARAATIYGKGDKVDTVPLPLDVIETLLALKPDKDGYFFTMPEVVTKAGRVRKAKRRMTYRAWYSAHRRACERAGIEDLRIHDLRHTAATRVVKTTGNLKMAQKLLRHSNIATTAKYAHVFHDDLRNALDAMLKSPEKVPKWRKG